MSVNQENLLNDLLVMLFNEILDVEQKALITGTFKEISINDGKSKRVLRFTVRVGDQRIKEAPSGCA